MKQIICAPDDEWIEYVAQMLLLGNQICSETIGQEMDGSLKDLSRIQAVLDTNSIPAKRAKELQALGLVFGKVFVNDTLHYDWWVVEDEYGKDICVRYKETTLMVFPQTMISKRMESGESVVVEDMYVDLKVSLERIKVESYQGE